MDGEVTSYLDAHRQVHWVKITESHEVRPRDEVYQFTERCGWQWLQKLCLWALEKIGAHAEETITVFRRDPQESDDLLKTLIGQHGQWIERVHHGDCRIFMGPEDVKTLLMVEHQNMSPVTFVARTQTSRSRDHMRWHDIPITVVPWMIGAILVPDDRK